MYTDFSIPTSQLSTQWQRIAFIASLCERHQGNHSLFCESLNWAEAQKTYRKALNKCWEYLAGQLTSEKNLEKMLLELETLEPDPSQSDSYGVYPALDAHSLLTSAYQMIFDESADDTEMTSKLSLQTVHHFVEFTHDAVNEDNIDSHPLVLSEIEFQQSAIKNISGNDSHADIVKDLRRWLRSFEATNLGIVTE